MMANRLVRRVLVVLYYLALFAFYPLLAEWLGILAVVLFLIFSPASAKGTELLKAYNDKDANLDERQESLVKDAFVAAYLLFAGLLIATSLANKSLDLAPAWILTLNENLIFDQLFTFRVLLILFATLPSAALMWLEPDPPADETTPGMKQAF